MFRYVGSCFSRLRNGRRSQHLSQSKLYTNTRVHFVTVHCVCSEYKINQCTIQFCTRNDEIRAPTDINHAATLKHRCQLNFTKRSKTFCRRFITFLLSSKSFQELSQHHLQFIYFFFFFFCSCEQLLYFLCILCSGTILFIRDF